MLTPKKLKFVDEYMIDFNATGAAERSGYSKKTAYSQGQRLLKDVEIAALIKKKKEELANSAKLSRDEIAENLAKVIKKFLLDGYNTSQALRAIEIYNKMHGYNAPDKVEHSSNPNAPFVINIIKPKDDSTAD